MKVHANFLLICSIILAPLCPSFGQGTIDKLLEIEKKLKDLETRLEARSKSGNQNKYESPPALRGASRTEGTSAEPTSSQASTFVPKSDSSIENEFRSTIVDKETPKAIEEKDNGLSFHFGYMLPGDADLGSASISFDPGVEWGASYTRKFSDLSYVSLGFDLKFFEPSGNLSIDSLAFDYSGEASMTNFYATLGQEWEFSDSFTFLTQASIGFALSDYTIHFDHSYQDPTQNNQLTTLRLSRNVSDSSFYYSFLLGLNYHWNDRWSSALYYELDGRSQAGALDYQNFHQIGLNTSFGF
jgi:hypothetical protein